MHRCHIPSLDPDARRIALPDEEASHLVRVLRAREGEAVEALDGQGGIARGRLRIADRRSASLEVDAWERAPEPLLRVTLYQALAKGEKMDWIIQKATELGVHAIQPVIAERSIARPEDERGARKQDRWRKVAINAIKQCGNPWLPEVAPVRRLEECLGDLAAFDASVAGAPEAADSLRDALAAARARQARRIACLVGPEGGFTDDELERLRRAGAGLVRLTPTILRTETAAVYFLSILAYEWNPW